MSATNLSIETLKKVDVDWPRGEWDELRFSIEDRVRQRARRRRLLKAAAAGVSLSVIAVLATLAMLDGREFATTEVATQTRTAPAPVISPLPNEAPGPGAETRTVRFPDGSTVTLLSSASTLGPQEVSRERTLVELLSGSARFEVTPRNASNPSAFEVIAGAVRVKVIGTAFTLDRLGEKTRVSVEHGEVQITWAGGSKNAVAGQVGLFPAPSTDGEPHPSGARNWRKLAGALEFRAAFTALQATQNPVRDEPGDLLLAADVARYAGHPARALPYLERLIRRHAKDDRAAAAAFTLGRVLLEDLRRPAPAAEAFAQARRLAPRGVLANDSRIREAESWLRAGQPNRVRELIAERGGDARTRERLQQLLRGSAPGALPHP